MSNKKRVGVDPLKIRKETKVKKEKKKVGKSVSKHTDIQTSKDTDKTAERKTISGKEGIGKRATFYIKPNLLRELKILAVENPEKTYQN